MGGSPSVVVSTAAFHEFGVRFPVSAVWKKQKMFLPHPHVKVSIVESLRDREVACSASDRQGSNFESCVWRTVSSQSSYHPQEVLLAQFSLFVHKGGRKPDSFHYIFIYQNEVLQKMNPFNESQTLILVIVSVPFNTGSSAVVEMTALREAYLISPIYFSPKQYFKTDD